MLLLKLLEQSFLGFISSAGFSILLLVPIKLAPYAGVSGMVGWVVYFVSTKLGLGVYFSNLLAAFFIEAISMYYARHKKCPATLFNIPGIVPLVPGAATYYMTYHLVMGSYLKGMYFMIRAGGIAVAIAAGLILYDACHRFYFRFRAKKL